MLRIRRFGVVQTATVASACLAAGFLALFLVAGVGGAAFRGAFGRFGFAGGLGFAGISGLFTGGIVVVIAYTIFFWIATAVACVIYNLVARWTGGIELQIEQAVEPPPPVWQAPSAQPGTSGQVR